MIFFHPSIFYVKKLVLFAIVFLEVIAGILFLTWVTHYRKHNANVVATQHVAVINKDSLVFLPGDKFEHYYELKPDSEHEDKPDWLPYTATYHYNTDGLNERENYAVEKPADTYRIITLGDSFTYGHFVNTTDNWTEQLEILANKKRKLCNGKKIEVINLGMRGFDIPYIVERYKRVGAKYHADIILWHESGTGFSRYNEFTAPLIVQCEADRATTLESLPAPKDAHELQTRLHFCHVSAESEFRKKYSFAEFSSLLTV